MKLPLTVTTFKELEALGLATIEIKHDEDTQLKDMLGDMFDLDSNPSIDPETLAEEKQQYINKINNYGVFGVVLEFTNGRSMQHLESLWGIDDYTYANTEVRKEFEQTAIDHFNKLPKCECCNQIKWPD